MSFSRGTAGRWGLALALLGSTHVGVRGQDDGGGTPGTVEVKRAPLVLALTAEGTLVPAVSEEISITPLEYGGELRVLEVVPHGDRVDKDEVILRLDPEVIEEKIHSARWALESAGLDLEAARAHLEDVERDAERDLSWAQRELDFARREREGYLERGRDLDRENYRVSERGYESQIEDQEDELEQLGKMYREDELTEETEEIVLKRARRDLELLRTRFGIFRRRHELTDPLKHERELLQHEQAVEKGERQLKALRREQATQRARASLSVEKAERALALARRSLERLQEDREALTVRAPVAGLALHGQFSDSVQVATLRAGQTLPARKTVITIAPPGALKVLFPVPERHRYSLRAGMAATIVAESLPRRPLSASLEPLDALPAADGSWKARLVFGAEESRLRPLLKCRVRLDILREDEALTVPGKALFLRDGKWVCYVVDPESGDRPVARVVTRGPANDQRVVVRKGLREGERILLEEPGA